jgi:hypothetical protein
MEKEKSKIQVRDVQTDAVLFECSIEEAHKAYQFAAEMETLGLDIKVFSPTLTETLSQSLGLSREAQERYRQSMDEEIESHEGSCCFEDQEKKIIN